MIGGDEGNPHRLGGEEGAPGRGAAARVTTLTFRSRMIRSSRPAFRRMVSGFFAATGSLMRSAPVTRSSPSRRPPSLTTIALPPPATTAPAMSIVVRSAPPASSAGMTCRTVSIRHGASARAEVDPPVSPCLSCAFEGPAGRTPFRAYSPRMGKPRLGRRCEGGDYPVGGSARGSALARHARRSPPLALPGEPSCVKASRGRRLSTKARPCASIGLHHRPQSSNLVPAMGGRADGGPGEKKC